MARPRKGKALSLRPIRLDDDVWAECQRLGKEHGTINEGLRARLIRKGIEGEMQRALNSLPVEAIAARLVRATDGELSAQVFTARVEAREEEMRTFH